MAEAMQFELSTPLGPQVLRLHKLMARESLGRISEFQLECLSDKADIDLDAILGKLASVRITLPGQGERFFSGYVTRFSHTGTIGRYQAYQARLSPWPWFLTRTADCRIFQNKTAPEIIKEIFADHAVAEFRDALSGSYATREYCVQYRETDFDFVCRLMEDEGIYFFFEYAQDKNVLVLADAYGAHSPVPGDASFEFVDNARAGREASDHISDWRFERAIQPGKTRIIDYDFKRPKVKLDAKASLPRNHDQAEHEIFDYPGGFEQQADGDHLVRARIDELQSQHELAQARTNARSIGCGMLFKLSGHVRRDQNREYLVTSSFIHLQAEGLEAHQGTSGAMGSLYQCEITALASQQEFRPPRVTPRPIVRGPQTAVVVGPSGDEIYTDKYGRVKVQFHWDRLGKVDENSSCWMRVSHPWAGKNWGFVAIPRIGQEVVVEFLEGDPDRPLITGSVYNGEQMPPYELPANMTQSGIKSRSSKGGTPENFNEIRFEDKKGEEQVFIHAEKNQDIEVENDETHWVGRDRKKTIDHDETVLVKHDRTETVGNNETISIGVNRSETVGSNESIAIGINRSETVGANENITIGANRTESVGANQVVTIGATDTLAVATQRTHTVGINETIAIGAAQEIAVGATRVLAVGLNQNTNVGNDYSLSVGSDRNSDIGSNDSLKVGKNLVIEAGNSVVIKTGSASITMKKDGTITIKGKDINLQGSGKINAKASGDVVIKGSKILQN
ncbi:type VI secretion system tip protein TssI/VgrG [Uliginosibacterium sp. 31-16]|uniref:type VI secretion system Vgr family protein n=1 Tax=Uliginosibacterium sp. 31-16 TaxID=3068315 RepID=UPI00273FDE4E|nr:type VI secretion system tip protein VgrG [Uliginosibacterium sp. 31-16]MDP5240084.1 type VI secretion system tip protein TssI/VgrG [Uliginosibacterium sp. 31-16]